MKNYIDFRERNADIQHRWCELAILCGWKSESSFIKDFLIEHQAMGIYLYSEMMISQDPEWCQLAKSIFDEINLELDASTRSNIQNILGDD